MADKAQQKTDREHRQNANEIARQVPKKEEQDRQRRQNWDRATNNAPKPKGK